VPVHDFDHRFAAIELAGALQEDRDLVGAIQVHRPQLGDLQAAALADRRVARDKAVVHGDGQDLRQQVDVHIDRAVRQWSCAAAVASAAAIRIGHHHRRAVFGGRRDLRGLSHLALAIPVDLGNRDLDCEEPTVGAGAVPRRPSQPCRRQRRRSLLCQRSGSRTSA
jgi:hypothetical protein